MHQPFDARTHGRPEVPRQRNFHAVVSGNEVNVINHFRLTVTKLPRTPQRYFSVWMKRMSDSTCETVSAPA